MSRKKRLDRKLHAIFLRDVGDDLLGSDPWAQRLARAEPNTEFEIVSSDLSADTDGGRALRRWTLRYTARCVPPERLFQSDHELSLRGTGLELFPTRFPEIVHRWWIPEEE